MSKLPAIAMIELGSIAAGAFAADKMVKRSPVELLHAGTVHPGKFLILVGGGTAEVEESYREAIKVASNDILDEVFLPSVHPRLLKALEGTKNYINYNTLVVLETSTVSAIVRAVNAAAKGALVDVAELRIANGLGGRGLAILTGELTDIEAATEIASQALSGRNVTLCNSILSNVHKQFTKKFEQSTKFFG